MAGNFIRYAVVSGLMTFGLTLGGCEKSEPTIRGEADTGDPGSPTPESIQLAHDFVDDALARGDDNVRLIAATMGRHDEIFDWYIDAFARSVDAGRTSSEDGKVIGRQVRDRIRQAFEDDLYFTSDENIVAHLEMERSKLLFLRSETPHECLRYLNGLPPQNAAAVTAYLGQEGIDLLIAVLEEPVQKDPSVASTEDAQRWVSGILAEVPHLVPAFSYQLGNDLSREQHMQVCEALAFMMGRMAEEEPGYAARLFRRTHLMAENG